MRRRNRMETSMAKSLSVFTLPYKRRSSLKMQSAKSRSMSLMIMWSYLQVECLHRQSTPQITSQRRMVAPSPSFDLTSSTIRHQTQNMNFGLSSYSRVSSDELTSWAEPAYDESLTENSVMQFLREPILTPSVSSSSLNATSKLQGSLEVNTEPNFLNDDWESFAW